VGRDTHYFYLSISFWGCASLFEGGRVELVVFVKLRGSRGFALSSIFMNVFCRELSLLHADVPTHHGKQYEID
jgi:hypothetical protein